MSTRLGTYSGLQDTLFTLFSGMLGWLSSYDSFFSSPLYDAVEPLYQWFFNLGDEDYELNCLQVGYMCGEVVSLLLNFNAPDQVYFNSVRGYWLKSEIYAPSFANEAELAAL